MVDPIALLQSLTLPAGATTGQRIFLDGNAGLIQIYNANNQLVGQIDASGIFTTFDPVNGSFAQLTADAAPGVAAAGLDMTPGPVASHTVVPARLFVYDDGVASGHRLHVQLGGPRLDNLLGVLLDLSGQDLNGNPALIDITDGTGGVPGTANLRVFGDITVTSRYLNSALKKIFHQGSFSQSTDANGDLTVTHGAGFTPAAVHLQFEQTASTFVGHAMNTKGATTWTARCWNGVTGALLTNVAVNGTYVCYP